MARLRLSRAVSGLLSDPRLEGASDAARLAAVVALSRNPMASGQVEIRAGEMGRWTGISESAVKSSVWPELRRAGAARVTPVGGEDGVPHTGVRIELVPLWEAKGVLGHPLAVERLDVVLLLRVLEALMAPGWGPGSPVGPLAGRTGRGAPRARLALLLLTLAARESGWVRLCGGTADRKHGRPATTLARLLGPRCSPGAAARVLSQLEEAGLIEVRRRRTGSGLRHRSGILVHAVAAAHGRETRSDASIRSIADPPSTARSIETVHGTEDEQVSGPDSGKIVDLADPSSTAPLHTDHSLLADVSGDGAGDRCFSGDRRPGCCRRPECACAREDAAGVDSPSGQRGSGGVAGGPLRGDKQQFILTTHDDDQEQPETGENRDDDRRQKHGKRPAGGVANDGPVSNGSAAEGASTDVWRATSGGRAPEDIADLVDAAPGLWEALATPGRQRLAARWIRTALRKIDSGLMTFSSDWDQPDARTILARRIARRCAQSAGGAAGARDVVGWLRGVVLPQRGCGESGCDDGIDMNHGTPCQRCGDRVEDGRRMRQRAWTETVGELRPGTTATPDQLAAYDQRLAELSHHKQASQADDARDLAAQRAQEAAAWEAGRADREAARAAAAEREARRLAQPCADCGTAGAAGLCAGCREDRTSRQLIADTLRLAAAAARITRPGTAAADAIEEVRALLVARIEADVAPLVAAGLTEGLAAARRMATEDATAYWHRALLGGVGTTEKPEREAAAARDAAERRYLNLLPADRRQRAHDAAANARTRAAQLLLDQELVAVPPLDPATITTPAASGTGAAHSGAAATLDAAVTLAVAAYTATTGTGTGAGAGGGADAFAAELRADLDTELRSAIDAGSTPAAAAGHLAARTTTNAVRTVTAAGIRGTNTHRRALDYLQRLAAADPTELCTTDRETCGVLPTADGLCAHHFGVHHRTRRPRPRRDSDRPCTADSCNDAAAPHRDQLCHGHLAQVLSGRPVVR